MYSILQIPSQIVLNSFLKVSLLHKTIQTILVSIPKDCRLNFLEEDFALLLDNLQQSICFHYNKISKMFDNRTMIKIKIKHYL